MYVCMYVCMYIYMYMYIHQILNIKKPNFKQDAFRLFSLKTFSTVHRSILSAIKIIRELKTTNNEQETT